MRKQQLDGLRFYAFLLVFFTHAGTCFPAMAFRYGFFGTDLFFALSGFLITRQLLLNNFGDWRNEIKTFYLRRTLRIFPLYYAYLIILLFCNLLASPLWCFCYVFNFKIFLDHFVPSIAHFWTLCVEEQYYLIYPILLLLTPSKWRLILILSLLCLFESMNWLLAFVPCGFVLPITRSALIWGSLAAFVDMTYADRKINGALIFSVGAILSGYLAVIWHVPSLNYWGLNLMRELEPIRTLSFTLVVWGLWRAENKILLAPFAIPPIAYLGKISYALYLFHVTNFYLVAWIMSRLPPAIDAVINPNPTLFILSLTITQAMLSWHFFEKPINDWKEMFRFDGINTRTGA